MDLVLVWNPGISYGLFPQVGPLGQWALLAVKALQPWCSCGYGSPIRPRG